MAFPVSPTNGSTTTVNGITYTYRASTQSWIRSQTPFGDFNVSGNLTAANIITTNGLYWSNGAAFVSGGGGGGTLTASSTPPPAPAVADQWYNTTTDVLYEYIDNGTNTYWIDVQSPTFNTYLYTNHTGNLNIAGNLSVTSVATITGNLTTVANLNVSRTANILGNLIIAGNGAFARNVTVSSNLTVTGNVRGGNITATNTLAAGNITVTTNIVTSNITVTSNVTAGNINVTRSITSANITGGNITTSNITATTGITSTKLTSGNITVGNINTSSTLAVVGNVEFSTANVNLGDANNLVITGGIDGNFLKTYGNGTVSWQPLPLTSIQEFTATGGQTLFTIVGEYTAGTVLVFVNGIQLNSADYTATSGTTVVLSDARIAGDIVRIISSVGGASLSSGLVLSVTNTKNFAVAMSVAMGM